MTHSTAQWEIVLGNSYAYTVLSAFGLFYAGFGFIITPSFGVAASYEGGATGVEYNNAVGFFVLSKSICCALSRNCSTCD